MRRLRWAFWAVCVLLAGGLLPALGLDKMPPAARPPFRWSRQAQTDRGGYFFQPAGLCEDYPYTDRTQAKLDRDFRCLHEVGAPLLRVGISWEDVEPRRGLFFWDFWDRLVATALRNHVTLIPYVCFTAEWAASGREHFWTQPPADPADFRQFMALIAQRYRGKVHSWELWNEPDNRDFWTGSVDQYAALVRAGAESVRQADPHATIVLGGMSNGWSPFFQTLVGQYHIENSVDVVNVHGYFETWNSHPLEDYPAYIQHFAGLDQHSPHPMDVWLAEIGYSSIPPGGDKGGMGGDEAHSPDGQAIALFKSHVLALATGRLSLTAWYRINDLAPGTDVIGGPLNWSLGILDVQGRPKPAFHALRFYNTLFGQPTRCRDAAVRVTPASGGASAEPVVHVFERADGTVIVVGWLGRPEPANGETKEEVSLSLPHIKAPRVETFSATGQRLPSGAAWAGDTLRHVALIHAGLFIARLTPETSRRRH